MPLYDCMLLMKPFVKKEMAMDLVGRVGKRVYQRNGVITDLKSFGTVQLGYGIKKIDGRHYKGQLMQMTMMVPPSFNKELQYLNKEDRLVGWLVVKHRTNAVYGLEYINEDEDMDDVPRFLKDMQREDTVYLGACDNIDDDDSDDSDSDVDDDDDDDNEDHQV